MTIYFIPIGKKIIWKLLDQARGSTPCLPRTLASRGMMGIFRSTYTKVSVGISWRWRQRRWHEVIRNTSLLLVLGPCVIEMHDPGREYCESPGSDCPSWLWCSKRRYDAQQRVQQYRPWRREGVEETNLLTPTDLFETQLLYYFNDPHLKKKWPWSEYDLSSPPIQLPKIDLTAHSIFRVLHTALGEVCVSGPKPINNKDCFSLLKLSLQSSIDRLLRQQRWKGSWITTVSDQSWSSLGSNTLTQVRRKRRSSAPHRVNQRISHNRLHKADWRRPLVSCSFSSVNR